MMDRLLHSEFFAVAVLLLGFGVCVAGLVAIMQQMNFVSAQARAEQLRQDVQHVAAAESEDVIGQVTAVNQQIAAAQRWNRVPVVQWWVPNGWDRLEKITLPRR